MSIRARTVVVGAQTTGVDTTQDIVVPNVTWVPLAVRIRWTIVQQDGAVGNTAELGCGLWDGTRVRSSVVWSQDNSPQTDCKGRNSTSNIIEIFDDLGTLDGQAAPSAFITGGVRIDWSDYPTLAHRLEVTFFYGSGALRVDSFLGSQTQNGTADITGMSAQPNWAYFFCTNDANAAFDNTRWSEGWAANNGGTTEQGCYGMAEIDTTDPTAPDGIVHNNRCATRLSGAGSLTATLELTAWNSDGVTLTTRDGALALSGIALLLRTGTKVAVKSFTLGVDSTGNKSMTLGLRPGLVDIGGGGVGTGFNSVDSGATAGLSGSGTATQLSSVCALTYQVRDNRQSTDTRSMVDSSKVMRPLNNVGGDLWAAELVSFDRDGWTINVTSAAGASKPVVVAAIGMVDPWPPIAAQHVVRGPYRRRLQRM